MEELEIYIEKIKLNPVKETWVQKHLPNLIELVGNIEGKTLSEKVFKYVNNIIFNKCKSCDSPTEFLSYNRGYRVYCSKKCSNNDIELLDQKKVNYKINNLERYGVDSTSKLQHVKDKMINSKKNLGYDKMLLKSKKTCLEKYGVDNISKLQHIKDKKAETTLRNYGVDNPFKSEEIKNLIKEKLIDSYGVDHPLRSEEVKGKVKKTCIDKYGVDNFTKTSEYKEIMFDKYRSGLIKTNLNTDKNYNSYIGLGRHLLNCDNGHNHSYETNSHLYHSRKGRTQCTVCFPVGDLSSFKEVALRDFITSIYSGKVIDGYRDKYEIDIYLPELNIGFEFNGLYWHSELFKEKNYHLDKTNYFKEKDIRIIHIWEDDWDNKSDIIKSQIRNWLGITENRIYARKCDIRLVNSIDEYRDFLDDNHIQGYTSASLKIGLYHDNKLVSLMTFDHFEGRKQMLDNEWNLSRFCNVLNTNVIGGASKLLNYFIKNYSPIRIVSFSDVSWSIGNIYYKLGFKVKSYSYPNYSYLLDGKRSNKQKWKKSKLVKLGYDKSLSESKIMEDNFGSYKIFDCGQIKFEIII